MQGHEIIRRKNSDYATGEDPFNNFRMVEMIGLSVEQGIMTRILDKFARLSNLTASGEEPAVADETVDDTILDLINYLAILHAYRNRNFFGAYTMARPEEYEEKQ